jgi:hypothetical protein
MQQKLNESMSHQKQLPIHFKKNDLHLRVFKSTTVRPFFGGLPVSKCLNLKRGGGGAPKKKNSEEKTKTLPLHRSVSRD